MAEPKLQKHWAKMLSKPVPKWHTYQGNSNDCGPFCATMAANALRDAPVVDAPTLARTMEEAPEDDVVRLLPPRIKGWATFPWGVVYALRKMGFEARWRFGVSKARLRENLDEDRVSIVIVGDPLAFKEGKWVGWAHYKVLYAWDPEDGWAFVDPAAPASQVYSYQDDEAFEDQWSWMGRHVIEVWDEEAK
ncbi:MAG: hypothetical protein JXA33_09465 [Anaerolineae bacterium]|nr:hypothetical protein [Anaerolineae bacterium]